MPSWPKTPLIVRLRAPTQEVCETSGLGSTHVFPIITEPSFVSYLNASLSRITLLRIIPAFGFVTTYFGTGHSFTSRLKTANNYDLIDTGRFAVFFHIAKIS